MTGRRFLVAVVSVALFVGGCGSDGPDPDPTGTTSFTPWSEDAAPLDTTGLVYALGSTVHLADGTTLDVGAAIDTYVLAGGAVYFTTVEDENADGYGVFPSVRPLHRSTGDGTSTRVADSVASLRSSPDGRYVAFIDLRSGRRDDYGTPQAETVVVDLRTAKEVVRSSQGMGDPASDDLAHDYPESQMGVLDVSDETAYVDTTSDVLAFDLTSGEASVSDLTDDDFNLPPLDDRQSPDGQWTILDDPDLHDRLSPAAGPPVTPAVSTPLLNLLWWVDDTTVAGLGVDGTVRNSQLSQGAVGTLVTCTVPDGQCAAVEGTQGQDVLLPEGILEGSAVGIF